MSEMVERVARKLEPQAWAALGTGDTLAYKNRRTSSLRKARAAIEAMREPTGDMIDAGADTYEAEPWITGCNLDGQPSKAFKAMIDASLKEADLDSTT